MLNLQFIFRSKRYFSMAPADIYALLIPMNYKLKKEEIRAIVEAATYEESQQLFRRTYYGKKYEHLSAHNLEEFYNYMPQHSGKRGPTRSLFRRDALFLHVSQGA